MRNKEARRRSSKSKATFALFKRKLKTLIDFKMQATKSEKKKRKERIMTFKIEKKIK